jgi:pimeloyl-ACP methyl ester carboxylesterase
MRAKESHRPRGRTAAVCGALRLMVTALVGLGLTGCYTLTKKDIFEVSFLPPTPATIAALSDAQHTLTPLEITAAGRPVSAYWDHGEASRGVLIFFCGNGYGAEAALRRMLIPARALGLDLVVFDYYDQGQTAPSMSDMRAVETALYDAATRLPTPAARSIFVGGHSLGATFALETAAEHPTAGVFVAAPATTGLEMIRYQLPYSRLAWLRPDEDYRRFDSVAAARRVHGRVIVFGSDGDKDLPPRFTDRVFAALPTEDVRKEVILKGVSHSEYFAEERVWRELASFFELPVNGNLVGYIRATPSQPPG